jgi:xanthine dehydrogenase accessory factor
MVRLEVLRACVRLLEAGGKGALATVVRTRGSSPAKVGSRMLVTAGGAIGTIGGSEMERQVIDRAGGLPGGGELVSYDLQYRKLGAVDLACGGAVDVLIEPVGPDRLPLFRRWLDALERRHRAWTLTHLEAGGGLAEVSVGRSIGAQQGKPEALVEEHAPRPHVLLVGGGHINRALAKLLDRLEFFYSVLDPRSEFASAERFPEARTLFASEPEPFLAGADLADFTYAVVCSHSQSVDFEAVKGLLTRKFDGGIGVIGSRSKRKDFERRLGGHDFSRVEVPVGLDIGAEGVEEIALSIAGSLVRHHRIGR